MLSVSSSEEIIWHYYEPFIIAGRIYIGFHYIGWRSPSFVTLSMFSILLGIILSLWEGWGQAMTRTHWSHFPIIHV